MVYYVVLNLKIWFQWFVFFLLFWLDIHKESRVTTPPAAPRGSARPVWCRTLSMGTVFLSAQSISPACWPDVASAGHNSEALAHGEGTRLHAATLPATNRRRCINCIMNCIYVYIHGSWFTECNHTGLFVYGLTGWRLSRPVGVLKRFYGLEKCCFFGKRRTRFLVQDMICKSFNSCYHFVGEYF